MTDQRSDDDNTTRDKQLEDAYRRAEFITEVQTLRIGAPHSVLDTWLREEGYACFAVITACNPRSIRLPTAINAARQAELVRLLTEAGAVFLPATGRDPSGAWPDEPGILLLDAPELGRELGRRYGQNAIVEGERGGEARLVWL